MTEPNALPPTSDRERRMVEQYTEMLQQEITKLQAENAALRKLIPLVDKVMRQHMDVRSPSYNGCDEDLCKWCLQASVAINEVTKARIG